MGLKSRSEEIREWVSDWIRGTAVSLEIGGPGVAPRHFISALVPGTTLELSLFRWPGKTGRLRVVFDAPTDTAARLTPELRRAIAAKCPKLKAASTCHPGLESLLLLEVADIALGNLFDLDEVVLEELRHWTAYVPDHLWLVDTTDDPPSVLIAKTGDLVGDDIPDRYVPFGLGGDH